MNRRQLEQYVDLKREISMLEEQIYFADCGGEFVTDVVRGSMQQPPYTQHGIIIQGYGLDTVPKLSARKAALVAECAAIERFIEGVEDSMLRQILIRRYIEGHSISETATLTGYSERQIRRLIKNFFEKMSANVR